MIELAKGCQVPLSGVAAQLEWLKNQNLSQNFVIFVTNLFVYMKENLEKQIIDRISKAGRGVPFFAGKFVSYGSPTAVRKALTRLVTAGKLIRATRGIYMRQKFDDVIGPLTPGVDELAEAIAKRDRIRIAPTGIFALNELGLSTQVPMNVIYLTDGPARKIKLGKRTLTFKRTTPKNVAAIGQTSRLVIQALRTIGKEKVTDRTIRHMRRVLKHEDRNRLAHDIRLAPVWIQEIIRPALT
jgi:hypothetical protein